MTKQKGVSLELISLPTWLIEIYKRSGIETIKLRGEINESKDFVVS